MKLKFFKYDKKEIHEILTALGVQERNTAQEKLVEISDKIFLFDSISKNDIITMTKNVKINKYKKNNIILKEDSRDLKIHYLINGTVTVNNNKSESSLATIKSGGMFGEMSFVSGKKRTANIIACENCITVSFDIDINKHTKDNSYSFSKLYFNISMDLIDKINTSNEKHYEYSKN